LESARKSHAAADQKLQTLCNLTVQLNHRLSESERVGQEELREERERRLQMSKAFSAAINKISRKLEEMGVRREAVAGDNLRLKETLKEYLEQFEVLEPTATATATDTEVPVEGVLGGEAENFSEANPLHSVGEREREEGEEEERREREREAQGRLELQLREEQRREEQEEERAIGARESRLMEFEDDVSRILHLNAVEASLRDSAMAHMEAFNSYQTRLKQSNELFTQKQALIEATASEIKLFERRNGELSNRAASCAASAKDIQAKNATLPAVREKEKITKAIERYRALIETFQLEIDGMHSQLMV
jgi:hypothetical protein